jgi:HTH-type transcriptional regulator / antitoxin HipB
MVIHTSRDLGAAIRAGRRALGLGQADLAARVGVRRQWVIKIEAGKSTAEVGLVLRTLKALGLKLEIGEIPANLGSARAPAGLSYDIDAALERTRPGRALGPIGRDLQSALAHPAKRETKPRPNAPGKHKR